MALYFLSYDLRKNRDYQAMYDELKKYRAEKVLESTWCFNSAVTTAKSLRDHFSTLLDEDDGLVVMKVTEWATRNTDSHPNQLK